MKHYSEEEWQLYVQDVLSEEDRREYEQHLYHCDECMASYLLGLEWIQEDLPSIGEVKGYTDELMGKIPYQRTLEHPQRKRGNKEKVFHYMIAMVMTFLLMASGVFTELIKISSQFGNKENSSFTTNVLNKTGSLMDQLEQEEE
ncbi:anti-sigma factor family protein [Bacillus sp. 2205SS5-2]|uniref:anti-sigma factor family protein n=1 Tax=Bacillus sp. 2205SS5-2 TaxID=3109031 RepID=UPI0030067DD7